MKEAEEFQRIRREAGFGAILAHAPYTMNLASAKPEVYEFACTVIREDVTRMDRLGIENLVFHPGSHTGIGAEAGIQNIIAGLDQAITGKENITVLLETMSGKGTEIGWRFEELKAIRDGVSHPERIGICLDTCHVFAAGYDIVNSYEDVINEFDAVIGLEYLKVIHLNDSKNQLGSHKDRHENIGFGNIGFNALLKVLNDKRFEQIPKILETPYVSVSKLESYPPYKEEIEMLKKQTFNENLKEEVIKKDQEFLGLFFYFSQICYDER